MGSSFKTLVNILDLTEKGLLAPGANICDIGATQTFGDALEEGARSFLDYYANKGGGGKRYDELTVEEKARIGKKQHLGDLLLFAGFGYTALDIFHATNTILFDLNAHAPGPALVGKFDMVMNFGTTEHVFNQLRSFETIHELTKNGGIMYHDLPMMGYISHSFFKYDSLFFHSISMANGYKPINHQISVGQDLPIPADLQSIGYSETSIKDIGLEYVMQKCSDDSFKIPLETSTSEDVDSAFDSVPESEYVRHAALTSVDYATGTGVLEAPVAGVLFSNVSSKVLAKMLVQRVRDRVAEKIRGS